jgi:hypothetical protein
MHIEMGYPQTFADANCDCLLTLAAAIHHSNI